MWTDWRERTVPPRCVACIVGPPLKPTAFCEVQKLWTALLKRWSVPPHHETLIRRYSRVDTHVHLHVDTSLKISHHTGNTDLKIVPSATMLAQMTRTMPSCDRLLDSTYVAPISSLLGTGGMGLLVPDAGLPAISVSIGCHRPGFGGVKLKTPRQSWGSRWHT
jgi:hypothetical protein